MSSIVAKNFLVKNAIRTATSSNYRRQLISFPNLALENNRRQESTSSSPTISSTIHPQKDVHTAASSTTTKTSKDGIGMDDDLVFMSRKLRMLNNEQSLDNVSSTTKIEEKLRDSKLFAQSLGTTVGKFHPIDALLRTTKTNSSKLPLTEEESNWPSCAPWTVDVPKLTAVRRDDQKKMLHVTWENGVTARFAYVWLRDNCPAPHTYQLTDVCKARKMVMADLDLNVQPISVENRGDHIRVEWPQGAESRYDSKWLALRNLDDERVRKRRTRVALNDGVRTWNADELRQCMRWYEFDRLLSDDRSLHDGLMELIQNGILFIENTPKKVGQLRRFAERVGFEYMTHYGKFFTVKSDANPSNVAYTSGGLGLHTDLPYLQYAPQIQALHCIEQVRTKGGENQFADAFRVAEQIRRTDPQAYRILCTVPLEYVDDGRDYVQFDLTYKRPVLNFDQDGRLVECHFSNQQRSWFYDVSVDELYDVYRALKLFDDLMRSPENMLELKVKPGQIVIFHNLRVLHGRSTFEMTAQSGGRHMEGCYLNWDFVKSQIRILRDRLRLEPNQVSV